MYEIMNGNHPFSSKKSDSQKILELIKNHQWIFNDKFSSIAQDFFFKLVAIDPNLRYTASQALKHPWITRKFNELIPFTFAEKISINNTTSQICVVLI